MSEQDIPLPDEAVPAPKRQWSGWIFLAFIFAALIALQANSYFGRKTALPDRDVESLLKARVTAHDFADPGATLDSILATLESRRKADINAERLWVITRYEAHKGVPPDDLERLRTSKLKDGPTLARIYEAKSLAADPAKRLAKALDDPRFSTTLARIHAYERAGLPSERKSLQPSKQVVVGLLALLLIVSGLVLWAVFLGVRASGGLAAEGHPAEPLTIEQADAFALRAAQLMGAFIIVPLMVGLAVPEGSKMGVQFLAEIGILAAVWILPKIPVDGERIPLSRIGFRTQHLGRDILYGVCATAMNFPILVGLGVVSGIVFKGLPQAEHPIQVELAGHPGPLLIISLLFGASIAAPIFEEAVFRGTFLPAVSRSTRNPILGVAITSILFATVHPTGIPAWPGLAALGAMSCLLAYQTKSLVPSMVMHGLNNAIALGITILVGS